MPFCWQFPVNHLFHKYNLTEMSLLNGSKLHVLTAISKLKLQTSCWVRHRVTSFQSNFTAFDVGDEKKNTKKSGKKKKGWVSTTQSILSVFGEDQVSSVSPSSNVWNVSFSKRNSTYLWFPMCEIIIIRIQKGSAAFLELVYGAPF